MAKIFKTLLLLVILAFEDANGRPPRKGITDGKFVNSQQSVTKDRYLLNTKLNESTLFAKVKCICLKF